MKKTLALVLLSSAMVVTSNAQARELEFEDVIDYYLVHAEGVKDNAELAESYALYENCAKFKQMQNTRDEFAKRKYEAEVQENFANAMKNLGDAELPDTFHLESRASFGKYNFDTQSFPFKPFAGEKNLIEIRQQTKRSVYNCSGSADWPSTFDVEITNAELFDGIAMPENQAAQINTRYGRGAKVEMELALESVNLNRKIDGKVRPKIRAKIIKMRVLHIDKNGRARAEMLTLDHDQLEKMNAEFDTIKASLPMKMNVDTIAAWAAHFGNDSLAEEYGVDVASIDLKDVEIDTKHERFSYPGMMKFGPKVPENMNDDGSANVDISWSSNFRQTGEEIRVPTKGISDVIVHFNNYEDYKVPHRADPEFVDFMSQVEYFDTYGSIIATPVDFKQEENSYGDKLNVLYADIKEFVFDVRELRTNRRDTVRFNESTIAE